MDLQFQPMTIDDLDQVMAIEQKIFPDPWPRQAFLYDLTAEYAFPIVVRWQATTIGYASLYRVSDELQIGNFAIDPAYQKRGFGNLLMRHIIALASELGIRQIYLEVRDSNEAARRLYLKSGFRAVGKRRLYYRNPIEDAIIMVKDIDRWNGSVKDQKI